MSNKEFGEASENATLVELSREPIELYKVLKFESVLSSGGEAKAAIAEGYVLLNGEVETQKRKKVGDGDLIEFQGIQLLLKRTPATTAAPKNYSKDKSKTKPTGRQAISVRKK